MPWVLFSVLASLAWAIVNVVDKYILTKWVREPMVSTAVLIVVGLIAGVAIYFIRGFSELSYANILLVLISGVFYMAVNLLYFKAVKIEEISRVVPLWYLTPLFVLLLASILLGEFFSPDKYIGIILLVAGAVFISAMKISKLGFGKAFWLMVSSSALLAVNQIITKYLLNFADFWTIFSWTRIGAGIALAVYLVRFPNLLSTITGYGSKVIGMISLNEVLNVSAGVLITVAAFLGPITLVNAMSSIQPLFVLIFAVLLSVFYPKILKEEIGKSTVMLKLIAVASIMAGAVLII